MIKHDQDCTHQHVKMYGFLEYYTHAFFFFLFKEGIVLEIIPAFVPLPVAGNQWCFTSLWFWLACLVFAFTVMEHNVFVIRLFRKQRDWRLVTGMGWGWVNAVVELNNWQRTFRLTGSIEMASHCILTAQRWLEMLVIKHFYV